MTVAAVLAEIRRRDRVLWAAGWIHFAALAAMLAFMPFDERTVAGVDTWVKPAKFAFSIGLYLWTVAWLLPYVRGPRGAVSAIRWGIAVSMTIEFGLIAMQGARGTTSHYNLSTAFDIAVFDAMGAMILVNTLLLVFLLLLFFVRPADIQPAYLWGIRLGIIALLMGSAIGRVMIMNAAHTVGAPDGGPALPLLNWSRRGGDLRIAHLLSLHAFQILPLAGHILSCSPRLSTGGRNTALFAFALVYGGVTGALFLQAMAGRPFPAL